MKQSINKIGPAIPLLENCHKQDTGPFYVGHWKRALKEGLPSVTWSWPKETFFSLLHYTITNVNFDLQIQCLFHYIRKTKLQAQSLSSCPLPPVSHINSALLPPTPFCGCLLWALSWISWGVRVRSSPFLKYLLSKLSYHSQPTSSGREALPSLSLTKSVKWIET